MLSNEQLATLSKEYQRTGDEAIFEYIYTETKGLIKSTTNLYCKDHFRNLWDEMYQEASLAFFQAVRKYDGENNAQFTTFAINCMKHQLLHYTRDSISPIKLPVKLRYARFIPTSISMEQEDKNQENRTFGDTLPDNIDIEGDTIDKMYFEYLSSKLKKEAHKQVFYYHHIQGLSLADIARIMGKHHSQISRWKKEINNILREKVQVNG